jgi:ZIP family zinc transporter
MPMLTILLIALGLAMDAFAASIASGVAIKKLRVGHALVVATVFGACQALMPVAGWVLGRWMYRFIAVADHWVAFGALLFVGGHMIIESLQPEAEDNPRDPLAPHTLLTLGLATSIDAFAIGISLSMLRMSILQPVLVICLVTFALCFAGVYLGRLGGHVSERKLEGLGGLVLIGLGAKILIEHLSESSVLFIDARVVWFALGLTLAAGLATGIGSALAFFARRTGVRRLSMLAGFSAGLLLWIAFRCLLPAGGMARGDSLMPLIAFFTGIAVTALIDRVVPDFGNPHETRRIEDLQPEPTFRRTDMATASALALHSFPEGLGLFIVALHAPPWIAVGAAIAIAIHNVPEGIATAFPMYYATGSRGKACAFSFLTGLSEPLGALIAYTVFHGFLSGSAPVLLTAGGAGVLVFTALDGLLPVAKEYGKHHHAVYGVAAGLLFGALFDLM